MKEKIPKAIREQVWISHFGRKFEGKCLTPWCKNNITVFDFQCGHDLPESKGGTLDLLNLFPICARCNLSMSDNHTFKEWCTLSKPLSKWKRLWYKLVPDKWRLFAIKERGIKSQPNLMNPRNKHTKLRGLFLENRLLPRKKRTATGTAASKKS